MITRAELIRLGPYRIFFPLGVMAGIIGVGHWMLWSIGWIEESNSFFHAMIQIEGFLSCFVFGFLMTALPRFLGAPPAKTWELVMTWGLELAVIVSLFEKLFPLAEWLYISALVSVIVFAARRLPLRTKSPPASFLLIGIGLVQALVGPVLILASGFGHRSYILIEVGRQMLQVGFMLCLVLGIAGYLAPFLMGYASDPSCDPDVSPIRGKHPVALTFHALTGLCILMSFLGTTDHGKHLGDLLRAIVVPAHLIFFAKIARPLRQKRTYVYFFWIACWMVAAGQVFMAFWPAWRIAGLHILFIGGFSLMIFSFGLLVVLSHAAQAEKLNTPIVPLIIVGLVVLTAMVLRVTADVDAWNNRIWLHSASGSWILAAGLWLIYIIPKIYRIPPTMESGPTYRSKDLNT